MQPEHHARVATYMYCATTPHARVSDACWMYANPVHTMINHEANLSMEINHGHDPKLAPC